MPHYPFDPSTLDALPEELAELYRALEDILLDEICSRLKLADQLNEVTVQDIRTLRSHGIDLKEIEKAIHKTTGISEKKLKELLDDQKWNITDRTDFASMRPEDYPILSDLYDTIQEAYDNYDAAGLYPREMLRDLLLGLHSMCRGADARFFNGHTNITSSKFLVFCVKGLDNMAENLRNTLLFSLLSYMSDQLLTLGNSVAAIDELYLWLSDPTVITYIRNALKRVRKKESALFLASQNLEDFTQPGIRELTRPLFSIPVHQFIFNGGNVDKKFFMDNLQLEESEYALIRDPQRGSCLYKCGNERYLLQVQAPEYKQALFGTAGGR